MSDRINGLRKQITEAKEGPLELRRKREIREMHLERGGWRKEWECFEEGEHWGPHLEGIYLEAQGRVPKEYS